MSTNPSDLEFLAKLEELEQQEHPNVYRKTAEIDGEIQEAFIVNHDSDDRYVEVCSKTGIVTATGDSENEFVTDNDYDWVYGLVARW